MQIETGTRAKSSGSGHKAIVSLRGVSKTYDLPAGSFAALRDVDLDFAEGEFVAIIGKSGSGKSTLVNVLTGIDRPTSGSVLIHGDDIGLKTESQLAAWRGRSVGIVFQFFQLLPTLTIAENVMLPMDLCSAVPLRERRPRALDLLRRVDIADQADKFPAMLSGGQQQRAAVARAIANAPPLLVADEPTGNLDSRTAAEILELFSALAAQGTTILIVTHEPDVLKLVDRSITLADGRVVAEAE